MQELVVLDRGILKGGKRDQALLISGITNRGAFSTTARSRFLSVVVDGVLFLLA